MEKKKPEMQDMNYNQLLKRTVKNIGQ